MRKIISFERYYIPACIVVMLLISCEKPERDDLSGKKELTGTVKYIDTIRGVNDLIVLGGQVVKLGQTEIDPGNNFLYSTTSKANGSFTFTNLTEKDYVISSEKKINELDFTGVVTVKPGAVTNAELILKPDTAKKNIVVITVKDKLTLGRLNKATVCFFSSALLAAANNCDGSFLTSTADQYGKVYTTGLMPGKYYINAQLVAGAVNIMVKDSIDVVRNTGIFSKVIYLE